MKQWAPAESRTLVRLSTTLASRMVHDAGASGEAIEVTALQTLRALKRGFLRLLADPLQPYVTQVPGVVAAGLRRPADEPVEAGRTYNLVLGFDRFGRGVFLLRPVPAGSATPAARTQSRAQVQMAEEMRQYLRSIPALPDEAP